MTSHSKELSMKWYTALIIVVGLSTPASYGESKDPPFYSKKAAWAETMYAARLRMSDEAKRSAERTGISPGPWYAIGPFKSIRDSSFFDSFAPEYEIALDKAYDIGNLRWLIKPEWKDGEVIALPPIEHSSTYAYRIVRATRDSAIDAYLGSDDGIRLWLNGSRVFARDVHRGCRPNQDKVSLTFKTGDNVLLLKVNNGEGAHGFYFSFRPFAPSDLWPLLERDFTDADSRGEMQREIADGIWDTFPETADMGLFASAYARATRFDTPGLRELAIAKASTARDWRELQIFRKEYHESITREFVILTPRPSAAPKINGPVIFGVRPGAPFLYAIPVTGARPIEFSAGGLPPGLTLDKEAGTITGVLATRGEYRVSLQAKNKMGMAQRKLRIVVGNTIALTPPLGWNSWNCFANAIDDKKVRSAADAMVRSGLADHGWTYINIDDCWMIKPASSDPLLGGTARDPGGMINSNRKFPDMPALSNYVHGKGLKLGIYSSPGPLTCAGFTASFGHELDDAKRFGEWGIDYLKYDWCSYGSKAKDNSLAEYKKPYVVMRAALDSVKRDIVFSLCQYGMGRVWEWGKELGGNCWRTTGDITDSWESMSDIGFSQNGHEKWAGPGHWNDPDMLVVGMVGWGESLHPTRLSGNEQYAHISLWSLLAAPLLIGCDMTRMDEFTYSLLTNDEVLEVNQDPLGVQAKRFSKIGDLEVWSKPMEDGSKAVGFFNRGEYSADVLCSWSELEIEGQHRVRDLWSQRDLGLFDGKFVCRVARHGVVLVRIF